MDTRFSSPAAAWTAIILIAALAAAYLVHTERQSAALLRADPDVIAQNPTLVHYGLAHGRSTYRSQCLGCHGENGVGDAARGIPVLSDADWLYGNGTISDIERIVTYGIRSDNPKAWNLATMPAFGRPKPSQANPSIQPLRPDQIRDVIELLMLKQGKPADMAAAARGGQIYQSVGACYDCHSPDARGDGAIGAPNLADPVTLYGNGDRNALYESIANGRQGVCPSWIGLLSPLKIREVTLYVYMLSHPVPPRGDPSL